MSVNKLSSSSKSRAPRIPYTQICNHVINNIKNGDAFMVWCYLVSKTEKWVVIKEHLKNRFGFGNSKLKKIFSYLHRSGLLKYCAIQCAKGKFEHWDIAIQDGAQFDAQVTYNVENKEEKQCAPVGQESTQWKNHPVDNGLLLNKDKNTKQREEHKNLRASDDAPSRFDEFWSIYPRKKDKARARTVWLKCQCDNLADMLINDVRNRINNEAQWQNTQFIPHPATYLRNSRWEDDVTPIPQTKNKETGMERMLRVMRTTGRA